MILTKHEYAHDEYKKLLGYDICTGVLVLLMPLSLNMDELRIRQRLLC
jgi:hypothetical protein